MREVGSAGRVGHPVNVEVLFFVDVMINGKRIHSMFQTVQYAVPRELPWNKLSNTLEDPRGLLNWSRKHLGNCQELLEKENVSSRGSPYSRATN